MNEPSPSVIPVDLDIGSLGASPAVQRRRRARCWLDDLPKVEEVHRLAQGNRIAGAAA